MMNIQVGDEMTYAGKIVTIYGGLGFVGSNLARRLILEQAKVTVVDNLFTGSLDNLKYVADCDYEFFDSTINDDFSVEYHVKRSDIVFNLAARNIIASTKDPYEDFLTNAGGMLNILLAMREHPIERCVYTSSASVYGNPKYLPINEDDSINLLTPYAVSKYAAEGYCSAFCESYNLPVVVLRLSNVYGTYQSPSNQYCGVVAKFMQKAKNREPIEIHSDGLSTRDYTFVDDVVDALLLAGLSSRAEGEVFNIATGIETNVNDLADEINYLYAFEDTDDLREIPLPVHIDRRDIDSIRRRVLNCEKARRKLGWTPRVTLQEGLKLTKAWIEAQNA
jgi:UDP-glucose 4-epimerase